MKFTDFKPVDKILYEGELASRGLTNKDVILLIRANEIVFKTTKSFNNYEIGVLELDDSKIFFISKYDLTFETTPDGDKLENGVILKNDMWNGVHYTIKRKDGETVYTPIIVFIDDIETNDYEMFVYLGYVEEVY